MRDWRDTVSVANRLRAILSHSRVLRFGYVYHWNPIPVSTLTPYIPATLEQAASIGYGWRRCNKMNVDLSYQFPCGSKQEVGTSSILGGDFDNSTVNSAAHWISISFVRTF